MDDFHGKDDLARCFVDQGHPGLLGTRIELDSDRLHQFARIFLQYDRKRKSAKHCSFSSGKKHPCLTRINRIAGLFVCVYYENVLHEFLLPGNRVTHFWGKVCLANDGKLVNAASSGDFPLSPYPCGELWILARISFVRDFPVVALGVSRRLAVAGQSELLQAHDFSRGELAVSPPLR